MPTDVGFNARPSTASDAVKFHADQVTIDGVLALIERIKLSVGDPGAAVDVSAAHPLPVSMAASADIAATLVDGRKTVPTPGTAVSLVTSSTPCKWVTITALPTNTAQVNVGGSTVLATVGGSTGSPLNAGDSITIPVSNANVVFIDARVAGEGVSFTVGS